MLSASVSRAAGGIFEAERRLAQSLECMADTAVGVFGIRDEHANADLHQWEPIHPQLVNAVGPKSFGYAPELLPALKAWQPDLTHQHSLWMFPSMVRQHWGRDSGGPSVITPHGMLDAWALRSSRWKKTAAMWLFERRNLETADCLHALNAGEAESFRRLGLTKKIAVIPNGVDMPPLAEAVRPGMADGKKLLLFLGRIHPKKGLVALVHAWRRRQGGEHWVLGIAGWDQGEHEQELKMLAGDAGDVVFLGPRFGAEKDHLLRSSEAFILPSFSEGLPMAVLEAWAYGKPVLMTPMCNLPQGYAAGAALRIEPEAASIVAGLAELFAMSDPDRDDMGRRGRLLVAQDFAWPRVAAQMREVYAWLLGQGAKPDCLS